jgi:hypothetical protein
MARAPEGGAYTVDLYRATGGIPMEDTILQPDKKTDQPTTDGVAPRDFWYDTWTLSRAGRYLIQVPIPPSFGINGNTNVSACVTEIDREGYPFIGGADIRTYNVAPTTNRVDIRFETFGHSSSIRVRPMITI